MRLSNTALAIVLGVLWLLLRILWYALGLGKTGFHLGVLVNMLFLIVIPFRALFLTRNADDLGLFADVKQALRPSVAYVILVTGLIFVYYNFADPGYVEALRSEAEQTLVASVPDEATYEALQKQDPALKGISRDEYLKRSREGLNTVYSPGLQTTMSLVALSIVAAIYGLVITVFFRRMYRRRDQGAENIW